MPGWPCGKCQRSCNRVSSVLAGFSAAISPCLARIHSFSQSVRLRKNLRTGEHHAGEGGRVFAVAKRPRRLDRIPRPRVVWFIAKPVRLLARLANFQSKLQVPGGQVPSTGSRSSGRATVVERVVKPHASLQEIRRVMGCERQPVMPSGRGDDAVLPRHQVHLRPQFSLKPAPSPSDAEVERQYPAAKLSYQPLDLRSQPAFSFALGQLFQTIEQFCYDKGTCVKISLIVRNPLLDSR